MEREAPVASAAETQEEIRQMLEAKSSRREARGEPPLDVEAELTAPRHPPARAIPPSARRSASSWSRATNGASGRARSRSTWRRK